MCWGPWEAPRLGHVSLCPFRPARSPSCRLGLPWPAGFAATALGWKFLGESRSFLSSLKTPLSLVVGNLREALLIPSSCRGKIINNLATKESRGRLPLSPHQWYVVPGPLGFGGTSPRDGDTAGELWRWPCLPTKRPKILAKKPVTRSSVGRGLTGLVHKPRRSRKVLQCLSAPWELHAARERSPPCGDCSRLCPTSTSTCA